MRTILHDEKLSKQVYNAAKRVSKKRGAEPASSTTWKRPRAAAVQEEQSQERTLEESLSLPGLETDEDVIQRTVLFTNRAPVVLAFAVALLKYTMPEQPQSSRLSLAQAVVSLNSRSKAVSLGLQGSKSTEDEGWGEGQPMVKIMGREVKVLKRWESTSVETVGGDADNATDEDFASECNTTPALWGLDLEALRSLNNPTSPKNSTTTNCGLPIHTPQSARDYLLKSFVPKSDTDQANKPSKKAAGSVAEMKKKGLGRLLGALDLLYASWAGVLTRDELDQKAWHWYVHVRPDVPNGVAGWGAKGELKLKEILELRRTEPQDICSQEN